MKKVQAVRILISVRSNPIRHHSSVQSTLKIDPEVMSLLKAKTPNCASLTSIANLLLLSALERDDTVITLGRALRPDPSKAVNKERRGTRARGSAQEELVHKPAPKRKPAQCHKVPEELITFEPLIRAYWKVKPNKKTKNSWDVMNRELIKIRELYGDEVVEQQLKLARDQEFLGITLDKYEKYGRKPSHRPGQAQEPEFKHPAHKVFTADEIYGTSAAAEMVEAVI